MVIHKVRNLINLKEKETTSMSMVLQKVMPFAGNGWQDQSSVHRYGFSHLETYLIYMMVSYLKLTGSTIQNPCSKKLSKS